MGLLDNITRALAPLGLNLVGTTPVSDYEALVPSRYHVRELFPEVATIIVIGNGGGEFWQRFRDYVGIRPAYLDQHQHPLDDYTVEHVEQALSNCLDQPGLRPGAPLSRGRARIPPAPQLRDATYPLREPCNGLDSKAALWT